MRRYRRPLGWLLVAVLVMLGCPLILAPPALALGACPPGTIASRSNGGVAIVRCLTSNGDYAGYFNKVSGVYDAAGTDALAVESDLPSSVIAAGEGASTTTAEAAGLAEADIGLTGADAGTLLAAADSPGIGQVAGTIVAGGFIGYEIGNQLANVGCDLGISNLCAPKLNKDTYVPNSDITTVSDPGFIGSQSFTITGDATSSGHTTTSTFGIAIGAAMTLASPSRVSQTSAWQSHRSGDTSQYAAANVLTNGICEKSSASPTSTDPADYSGTGVGSVNYGTNTTDRAYSNTLAGWCPAAYPNLRRVVWYSANQGATNAVAVGWTAATKPGTVVVWVPPGNADRPAGTTADPLRAWQVRLSCSDGTSTSSTSSGWHESDASLPPYPAPVPCAAPATMTVQKVYELNINAGTEKLISTLTVPDAVKSWQQNYPGCTNGVCRLGLYKRNGSKLVSCFPGGTAAGSPCAGWFEDPNKTDNYVCTYGKTDTSSDAAVALSECNLYAPSFDPQKQGQGIPYADPKTGDVPVTNPVKKPGGAPGGSTDPGTGSSDPGGSGNPLPGQDGASCFPSGWGVFNPLEWVLKPVECALVWAFVPTSGTLTDFTTAVSGAYNGTVIGQWLTAIGGIGNIIPPVTGCGGVQLHIPNLGVLNTSNTYTIFDTCDEPWHTAAFVVKSLLIVMIVWFSIMGVFRIVSSSFGMDLPTRGA